MLTLVDEGIVVHGTLRCSSAAHKNQRAPASAACVQNAREERELYTYNSGNGNSNDSETERAQLERPSNSTSSTSRAPLENICGPPFTVFSQCGPISAEELLERHSEPEADCRSELFRGTDRCIGELSNWWTFVTHKQK